MVNPIHLQDLFSKVQLAEKVTQVEKQQPDMSQRQFNQQLQLKIEQDHTQTKQLEPKDEMIIHQQDKNPERKEEQPKKKEEPPDDEQSAMKSEKISIMNAQHIDIRI